MKKEEFAKNLENLIENLSGRIDEAVKDISNAIMFLSLYCGENMVMVDEVKLKINGFNSPKIVGVNQNFDETAQKSVIKSYEVTQSLEFIISNSYLKIEKKTENNFSNYFVEYICDKKGNYIRNASHKSIPIDRELRLEERSLGSTKDGVYYSETIEKNDGYRVVLFKTPDKNGNILYSYSTNNNEVIMYYAPLTCKKIPTINAFGMAELSDLFSRQFDENFPKIKSPEMFTELAKRAKMYYKL